MDKLLPETLNDSRELREVLTRFNLIPYFGLSDFSSHSTLKLLYDLYHVSPHQQTILTKLNKLAFTGGTGIQWNDMVGLGLKEDLKPEVQLDIALQLAAYGIKLRDIGTISQKLCLHLKICGNAWLKLRVSTVAGVSKVTFKVLHPMRTALTMNTDRSGIEGVIEGNFWHGFSNAAADYNYHTLYPQWGEDENGIETVIHFKSNELSDEFYGEPLSAILLVAFADAKNIAWVAKSASTDTVAKYLYVEEEPPTETMTNDTDMDADFKNRMGQLRRKATAAGGFDEATTIVGISYPNGAKEPNLKPMDVFRDSNWLDKSSNLLSSHLHAAYELPPEITGYSQTKGGIGSSYLNDLYSMVFTNTILPEQDLSVQRWQVVNEALYEAIGDKVFVDYVFKHTDRRADYINMDEKGDKAKNDVNSTQDDTDT